MAQFARIPSTLTASEFIATDQCRFGNAWRYELIDGVIVGHAAPSPTHGVILANLVAALKSRLKNHAEACRVEAGSAATPERQHRDTARIPDALVRCKGLPRVTFEVVSPSELQRLKDRDGKRQDVKDVAGVVGIVEIYQHTVAAHLHAKTASGVWSFTPINGADKTLDLASLGISIPLTELYEGAMPDEEAP